MLVVRFAPEHLVHLHDEFEGGIAPFNKKFLHPGIGMIKKQVASRRLAIAPGAACLLIIRLYTPWHVEMHDKTNIRPIDSHPECVRRHHNIAPALHEFVLRLFALLVVHPAVVKNARDLRQLERFGDRFHSLSGRAVDDACFVFVNQRVQALVFLRFVRDRRNKQS